jgi:hypothetical protein
MNSDDIEQPPNDESDTRLPYEPPAVVSEETFETLAIACGKMSGSTCITGGGISS